MDGRINIYNLEDEPGQMKINKCQNKQDTKIPIVKVLTSKFGIGIAVDIKGNCRFYDLVRLRKMAKITPNQQNVKQNYTW